METLNEDNIYVCRCEEVTVGDIRRAMENGASSIRDIKMRTHAGMGVCQGMTCRKNIERILRGQKIDLDVCHVSQRFPVRMVNIGELCGIFKETEQEKNVCNTDDNAQARGGEEEPV